MHLKKRTEPGYLRAKWTNILQVLIWTVLKYVLRNTRYLKIWGSGFQCIATSDANSSLLFLGFPHRTSEPFFFHRETLGSPPKLSVVHLLYSPSSFCNSHIHATKRCNNNLFYEKGFRMHLHGCFSLLSRVMSRFHDTNYCFVLLIFQCDCYLFDLFFCI